MSELVVEEAVPADTPEILEVLRAALGETDILRRTPDLWHWKHRDNPFGPSIVLLARQGGRIAGVRALMRWELRTPEGEALRCVRPVDTATHPDFLRRGLFRRLTEEALEVARAEGIDLVFNTPNRKSGPGYLSMGWREVGWIRPQVRLRLGVVTSSSSATLESVIPIAQPFRASAAEDRPPLGLRTPRTARYQEWRYASHPTVRYGTIEEGDCQVVMRTGVRRRRAELVVSDLAGEPAVSVLRRVARSHRAAYLAGFFSVGTPERRAAIRAGLLPVPGLRPLRLVARPLRDLGREVHDLRAWDLSTGDLELL